MKLFLQAKNNIILILIVLSFFSSSSFTHSEVSFDYIIDSYSDVDDLSLAHEIVLIRGKEKITFGHPAPSHFEKNSEYQYFISTNIKFINASIISIKNDYIKGFEEPTDDSYFRFVNTINGSDTRWLHGDEIFIKDNQTIRTLATVFLDSDFFQIIYKIDSYPAFVSVEILPDDTGLLSSSNHIYVGPDGSYEFDSKELIPLSVNLNNIISTTRSSKYVNLNNEGHVNPEINVVQTLSEHLNVLILVSPLFILFLKKFDSKVKNSYKYTGKSNSKKIKYNKDLIKDSNKLN